MLALKLNVIQYTSPVPRKESNIEVPFSSLSVMQNNSPLSLVNLRCEPGDHCLTSTLSSCTLWMCIHAASKSLESLPGSQLCGLCILSGPRTAAMDQASRYLSSNVLLPVPSTSISKWLLVIVLDQGGHCVWLTLQLCQPSTQDSPPHRHWRPQKRQTCSPPF